MPYTFRRGISPAPEAVPLSDRSDLTLVGLSIPPVTILADYMRLVGDTAFAVKTDVSYKGDFASYDDHERTRTIYLRASLSEIASLVYLQDKGNRSRDNLLVAQYYDRYWRTLPSITLEQALTADSFVPSFLTTRFGLEILPDSQKRLSDQFSKFRAAALIWCDPLLWLERADLHHIRIPSIFSVDLDYSFGLGGAGTTALAHGWHGQESWGVWSRGFSSTLSIRTDKPTARLIFTCCKLRPDLKYTMLIDGQQVPVIVRSTNSSDILIVEVPNDGTTAKSQTIRVQFLVANPMSPKALQISEDARTIGLGIKYMRLESFDDAGAAFALWSGSSFKIEDQLLNAGFKWTDVSTVDNALLCDIADIQGVLDQLSSLDWTKTQNILVISAYPGAVEILFRHALGASALVVSVKIKPAARHSHGCSEVFTSFGSEQKIEKFLVADISEADPNGVLSGTFDAVCILDVEGSDDLVSALNLASLLIALDGIVIGSERSKISNRTVMGRIAATELGSHLVVLIHNTFWQGRRVSGGAQ